MNLIKRTNLSQNIIYLRERYTLDQKRLSKYLRIPLLHLKKIEIGEILPSFNTVNDIAELFDVKIDDLLNTRMF